MTKRNPVPKRRPSQRGSSMVEMALILPIFFMMVFGFLKFSWILFGFCNATYASRAAVRYAVVHGASSSTPCSASDLQTIAGKYLWGAPNGAVTYTISWTPDNTVGSTVSMRIAFIYPVAIPFSSLHNVTVGTSAQGIIVH